MPSPVLRTSVTAFRRRLLAEARDRAARELGPLGVPPAARQPVLIFGWTGGGAALALGSTDPVLLEVGLPSQIVWAHLYAGGAAGQPVAVTATVDLRLTQLATFATSTPLYGSGTIPTLTAASSANLSLTGWQINLVSGDALIARLRTYSGAATWLTLAILLRPTEVPLGVVTLTNNALDPMTDNSGDPMVFRS